MKMIQKKITIRDLSKDYGDFGENGVFAYGGRLNVRPPFQREFIYDDERCGKVIDTVFQERPLNLMYWSKKDDGTYEVIDGQQRTIAICEYVKTTRTYCRPAFSGLTHEEQQKILDYELIVFVCEGSERDKLDWFKTINIQGVVLTEQELLNAAYNGQFVNEAKRMFSKRDCNASKLMDSDKRQLFSGESIRQEWLGTVLKWIADKNNMTTEDYMGLNKNNNAASLWSYFENVYEWVKKTFRVYRKEMKGIEWGLLYNRYGQNAYDPQELEEKTKKLMIDDDVTRKKGIYKYLLTGEEKHLNIRQFTEQMKRSAYERQYGICPHCVHEGRDKIGYEFEDMEGDHIIPWSKGGRTNAENCQMLCKEHNRSKSSDRTLFRQQKTKTK